MEEDGTTKVPQSLEIVNNNTSGIKCTVLGIDVSADWKAIDFDTDITSKPDDTKEIALSFRGDKTDSTGVISLTESSWNFGAKDSLPLNTKVKIPKQSESYTETIATANWEFDWSDSDVSSDPNIGAGAVEDESWYNVEGGTITGFSNTYLNLNHAPTDLIIPSNINGTKITAIGAEAFKDRTSLTSIVMPNTVTDIAADAFSGVNPDLKIDVSYADYWSIGNAPWGAKKYNITWKAETMTWDVDPIQSDDMWRKGFESILSDGTVRISKSISEDITEIEIPTSIDGKKVTGISRFPGYTDNTSVTRIHIPDTVTAIKNGAFAQLKGVKNIEVPKSVTSIEQYAFNACTNLESINIPANILTIAKGTFFDCKSLTNIVIPNSVTTIEDTAFYGCTGIESITIPSSVTTIGTDAFLNVPEVRYNGTATGSPWGAIKVVKE